MERGIAISYETTVPKRIITDKLRAPMVHQGVRSFPDVEHRSHKGLNNRAENSHVPFRKGERMPQGFRSIGSLQPANQTVSWSQARTEIGPWQ